MLSGLAGLCRAQGREAEAETLYQRALGIREQAWGGAHPDVAETLSELALLRQQQGRLREACSLAQRARAIRAQTLGEAHPTTLATHALSAQLHQQAAAAEEPVPAEREAEHRTDPASERDQAETTRRARSHALAPGSCEGDPVQGFLAACCELHPSAWSHAGDLWRVYERWAATHQERFPLSRRAFLAQLKAHGCRPDRTKTARIWRGIALVHQRAMTQGDGR
jgi:hypothetical protein